MDQFLLLFIMSATTFRLTHLITADTFPPIRWVREQIADLHERTSTTVIVDGDDGEQYQEQRGPWEWLSELATCAWCVSVWVAAGVTVLTNLHIELPLPWLWFGATAAGSVVIHLVAQALKRE